MNRITSPKIMTPMIKLQTLQHMSVRRSISRTGFSRAYTNALSSSSVAPSRFVTRTEPSSLHFRRPQKQQIPQVFRLLSSSSFVPPPVNTYHGDPIYDDIPMSSGVKDKLASSERNLDPDAVFIVTGASRGIGLQFVKSLLQRTHTKSTICACCRSPENAVALREFLSSLPSEEASRIKTLKLDVTDTDQIAQLASDVETKYNARVDGLFNIAGVLGDAKTTPGPERNISQLDQEWFQSQMNVNVIGPMLISKALAPYMRVKKQRSKKSSSEQQRQRAPSVLVNMSARVGSITDNTGGLGWHSYRMSKAALNMGTRIMGNELKRQGTWSIALYPGFTDTDGSMPFQRPAMKEKGMVFPVEFTANRLLDVIDGMEEKHSGGFYDWAGQALPF